MVMFPAKQLCLRVLTYPGTFDSSLEPQGSFRFSVWCSGLTGAYLVSLSYPATCFLCPPSYLPFPQVLDCHCLLNATVINLLPSKF